MNKIHGVVVSIDYENFKFFLQNMSMYMYYNILKDKFLNQEIIITLVPNINYTKKTITLYYIDNIVNKKHNSLMVSNLSTISTSLIDLQSDGNFYYKHQILTIENIKSINLGEHSLSLL